MTMDLLKTIFDYIEQHRTSTDAYYNGHPITDHPEFGIFLGIYLIRLHADKLLNSDTYEMLIAPQYFEPLCKWNDLYGHNLEHADWKDTYLELKRISNIICFNLNCTYHVDFKIYGANLEPRLEKINFKHLIHLSNGYHAGVKELGSTLIATEDSGFNYISASHFIYLLLADKKASELSKLENALFVINTLQDWFNLDYPPMYVQPDDPYFKMFDGLYHHAPVPNLTLVLEYFKLLNPDIPDSHVLLLKETGASFKDVMDTLITPDLTQTNVSIELPTL